MTVEKIVKGLRAAKARGVKHVTYGDADLGIPVPIDDAIGDISVMEDWQVADWVWLACDEDECGDGRELYNILDLV